MMLTSRRPAASDPATPASSRGAALWAAVVLVALPAALAVVVFVLPGRDATPGRSLPPAPARPTGPPAASAASAGSAASAPADAPPSAPPAPGPDQCPATPRALTRALPARPPAGVTWTLFHGVAQPTSPEHGPHRRQADVDRCFAHTPTGALIAAWQIATRFVLADDWRRVVELQVMPGPGRDAYVAQRARIRAGAGRDAGGYGQLAAFGFASYTPQVATVQLVSRFAATGQLQVNTVTVVWSGDDWRLLLQPGGSISPSLQAVSSLTGFVPWAGV
ncbi:hypothetical protein LDL08_32695 [Nonomuraea glycinis]|uniref:DUF8175 domain-containing protein n=1 Tax=Nonomuraea glycinis TaxID=2047744 RepID=A0A918E7M2_9ACTN|nr:hypothetical protein [Nonomuraea glycinis]MCA2180950.1 hypothetical protein [Nonomuraea glycinis]GGP13082.1 hypothetical protein GCM10012278_63440 [Nonomuraea glycinis]